MKKKKVPRQKPYIFIYAMVLVCLLILVIFLVSTSVNTYHSWRSHQSYFKENHSPAIELWMTPNTILRHFNISKSQLFQELSISPTDENLMTSLTNLCTKNKLDCLSVKEELNSLVR